MPLAPGSIRRLTIPSTIGGFALPSERAARIRHRFARYDGRRWEAASTEEQDLAINNAHGYAKRMELDLGVLGAGIYIHALSAAQAGRPMTVFIGR